MKILTNNMPEKPDIDYPTRWAFKLIGRDQEALIRCIKHIMKETGNKKHTCAPGNKSKTGKFHAYNTSCIVNSEAERNKIFKYFSDHDDIDMVI